MAKVTVAPAPCDTIGRKDTCNACASELEPMSPKSLASVKSSERWVSQGQSEPAAPGSAAWVLNDVESIKQQVRQRLLNPVKYSVFELYHKTGRAQAVARSARFDNLTLSVITLNAVWIAIDTDWNNAETLMLAHPVFIVAENFFCVYFSAEWIIRFLAFERKCNCLKDGWFIFDSVLVFFMVMETWVFMIISPTGRSPFGDNTAILRLFRLLRLSRLVKLLKSLPELMILIKGMITAMQSVGYVILLLLVFTYVFAIACTQLSVDAPLIHEQYFDHVAMSMYSLIIYGTFLDALSDFMNDIRGESVATLILVVIFVALSALTVMNMLIGVLCEVIASVAETEKETLITERVIGEMKGFLGTLDEDDNGMISFNELKQILMIPEALAALDNVGVDPIGMVDFAETFFFDEKGDPKEISFLEFMELVLDLRSTNGATVKDIMNLGRQLNAKMLLQQKAMEKSFQAQQKAMEAQQKAVEAMVTGTVHRLEKELKATSKRIEDKLEKILPKSAYFGENDLSQLLAASEV
eukprot:TRINITY_DN91479_c0_g1_i1.p1 TRINITY_DN91479_c0_g1~~TRINITY_DN91479_c0_g1_i1.p1  ORF type:complete len:526 (+),score=114.22 TRINITY_DN91479_c0_g1_i1:100-1677(+)